MYYCLFGRQKQTHGKQQNALIALNLHKDFRDKNGPTFKYRYGGELREKAVLNKFSELIA